MGKIAFQSELCESLKDRIRQQKTIPMRDLFDLTGLQRDVVIEMLKARGYKLNRTLEKYEVLKNEL